jgi:CheY-like chemotaxis protein
LTPVQRDRAAGTIARNAVAQARIIDDILDASHMVTGKLRRDAHPIQDLASVVAASVDTMRAAADAKSVTIQRSLDPYAGTVLGDAQRIQQIVWNLCSNAVRFTPSGGRVDVSLARGEGTVELRVSDTGEGIAPDFLPYVFDRFRQADASSTRRHGGLGLGLAIARHLTELHGGTIVAESAGLGHGSTFVVRFPAMPSQERRAEDAGRAPARSPMSTSTPSFWSRLDGRLVLAVDDDSDALETVRAVLESGGARVLTASSAEEALAVLEIRPPHLLISDIGMPGRDGYWLIRQVRSLAGNPAKIPAIALTAYARREDRVRALSEGYQAHLGKPVEPAELLAVASSVSRAGGEISAS